MVEKTVATVGSFSQNWSLGHLRWTALFVSFCWFCVAVVNLLPCLESLCCCVTRPFWRDYTENLSPQCCWENILWTNESDVELFTAVCMKGVHLPLFIPDSAAEGLSCPRCLSDWVSVYKNYLGLSALHLLYIRLPVRLYVSTPKATSKGGQIAFFQMITSQ